MSVSDIRVVDAVGLDRLTGVVHLTMYEERDWLELEVMVQNLEGKIKNYLGFSRGGQLEQFEEFRGKPIQFDLHCQSEPPQQVMPILRSISSRLASMAITFEVYIGSDKSTRLRV